MTTITDDFMMQMMSTTKAYTVVVMKTGPEYNSGQAQPIIWEHARRNFALRAEGVLSIVCPVRDSSDLAGVGIFNTDEEQTKAILDDDPAVKAGVLIYEMHPTRSFPKDYLPG